MDFLDYPHIYPPPGFIRVDRTGTVVLNPLTSNVELDNIQIPIRYSGWLVQAGIELADFSTGAFLTLAQGGIPLRDYTKIVVPLGSPATPAMLHVQLFPDQIFQLLGSNPGANAIAARWRLYGWYYPGRS